MFPRFRLPWQKVAVADFGSNTTRVCSGNPNGKDWKFFAEPSFIAFDKKNNRVEAVGNSAREMYRKTSTDIIHIKPFVQGLVDDFDRALAYVERRLKDAGCRRLPLYITVPPLSKMQATAFKDLGAKAKASETKLLHSGLCAAIGAGMDITLARGQFIVQVGSGVTCMTVISGGGVVNEKVISCASGSMINSIVSYVKKAHAYNIGEVHAETVLRTVGSALDLSEVKTVDIQGRSDRTRGHSTLTLSSTEIHRAISDEIDEIVDAIMFMLQSLGGEIYSDVYGDGITLCGAGALLQDFDKRIRLSTGLPVTMAEEPMHCTAIGGSRAAYRPDLLERVALDHMALN